MNILYDHQTFSLQEYGGISRYFSELIQGVNQHTVHNAYLSAHYTNNIHAHDLHLSKRYFFPNSSFSKKMPILYRVNKAFSTYDLLNRSYDIVHATYYDPYFLRLTSKRPKVITFLDMIHERFSDQFNELSADRIITMRKREVAKQADHIIAISRSTKADIVNIFGTDPDKISVTYLGSSFKPNTTLVKSNEFNNKYPYILFVGKRSSYKNFEPFIKAVRPLLKAYGIQVICAGGGDFSKREKGYILSLGLSNLVFQKAVDDHMLHKLYSEAILFVFPSLYEGFGIPILEAFSCDCPCVVSNQSSLPEVGGEAAVYFNPHDTDSIAESIRQVLDDRGLQLSLIERGRKQLSNFSWKSTVDQTVALYENL